MATMSRRPADRAQLLIVAAIGIAILLTALALALNTAVYAEVHVSETADSTDQQRDALRYQESVRRAVAELIVSDQRDLVTQSDLQADLETWHELAAPDYARGGVAIDASVADTTTENWIVQNETGTFEDQSGASNWTVASNVSAVDTYDAEIQADGLGTTDGCNSAANCTVVTVTDGADSWQMFVYRSPGDQTVEIDVKQADGTNGGDCTADSSASVNLTSGEFVGENGTTCTFTSFRNDTALDSPYTVRYDSADKINGTYNLSVTGDVVEGSVEDDDRYGTTGSPRIERDVVAANVTVRYQSPDLTYQAEIRVDPGETDD